MAQEKVVRTYIGELSYKPPPDKQLVPQTLDFIFSQLPRWRDDAQRPRQTNEKQLNSSLCDFLDNYSRTAFPMVRFKHEAPQAKVRTVDLGVHGMEEITVVGTRRYTIYQPFLVIEAKRLPAPSTDREREYVVGTDKPTGGIQRFRLGLHGADVETAVIIGYVETESLQQWHLRVNEWITDFASEASRGDCVWSQSDLLGDLTCNKELRTSSSESNHQRSAGCLTPSINLRHFWAEIAAKPVT
jgi:hypothetical protein